ncbi:MAG: MoxR family ATPase [Planctomycetota bacterium]
MTTLNSNPKTGPHFMLDAIAKLRDNIESIYLGDHTAVDRVIRCLLARGHMLIEDVPGVGKTVLASAVAKSLDCTFSRIQLTPDMLPADVLGVTVFNRDGSEFEFKKGPIFANVVLADEINRTTPRTQSALLEAMSDASVSIDGKVYQLDDPFIVIATQNPYEFEGTYLLPENQLDRFLMRIQLGYPSPERETDLLEIRPAQTRLADLPAAISRDETVAMQRAADAVTVNETIRDYIVRIATATREAEEIEVGISPRGSLALAQVARATALIDGRDYCIPDDVYENILPVCAHRIITKDHGLGGSWNAGAQVLENIVRTVASPA